MNHGIFYVGSRCMQRASDPTRTVRPGPFVGSLQRSLRRQKTSAYDAAALPCTVGGTGRASFLLGVVRMKIPPRAKTNPTINTMNNATVVPSRASNVVVIQEIFAHSVHVPQSLQVHFVVHSSWWFSHHPSHFGSAQQS